MTSEPSAYRDPISPAAKSGYRSSAVSSAGAAFDQRLTETLSWTKSLRYKSASYTIILGRHWPLPFSYLGQRWSSRSIWQLTPLWKFIAAKHFIRSSWSQKKFDRTFRELSNGMQLDDIQFKSKRVIIYLVNVFRFYRFANSRHFENLQRLNTLSHRVEVKRHSIEHLTSYRMVCSLMTFSLKVNELSFI